MSKQKGRPRDVAKEQFWREMIQRQQQGRHSVRGFCDEHALDEGAFFAWRRKLVAMDVPVDRPAVRSAAPAKASTAPTFAQITLGGAVPADDGSVDIVLAGRRRVRVPPGFDQATLAAVLDVLEDRPC
jgi:hypothetical protein